MAGRGARWLVTAARCFFLSTAQGFFVCFDKLHCEERIPLTLNSLTHIPTFPEAMAQSATFDRKEDRANGGWGPTKSLSRVRHVILYTLPFNWNTKKLEQKSKRLWSGHGNTGISWSHTCIYDITIDYYCFWMMPLYKSIPSTIGQLKGHLKDPWESSKVTRERLPRACPAITLHGVSLTHLASPTPLPVHSLEPQDPQ